jgi:hypothetical protein
MESLLTHPSLYIRGQNAFNGLEVENIESFMLPRSPLAFNTTKCTQHTTQNHSTLDCLQVQVLLNQNNFLWIFRKSKVQ